MRLLIVSPWLPQPEIRHAGGQHLYHMICSLAERGHEVSAICYHRGETDGQIEALRTHCRSVELVRPAYGLIRKIGRFVREGWRRPSTLGRWTHISVRTLISSMCRRDNIELVHFCWTEMGRYVDAVPEGVAVALGTLDVEYLVRPREVALYKPGWNKFKAGRVAQELINLERFGVPRVDVVLACSPADREHLGRLADPERIFVVPPWIACDAALSIEAGDWFPGRLIFMGAMDRFANGAAARFLLDEVWPLLRDAHPGSTLLFAGAEPPDWLRRRVAGDRRLAVTGLLPDLVSVWAECDIALSPSLIGGGLVTKVAQPLAAARPVVTTTLGNEGVAARPGEAIEVADDGPAFARAVLHLLRDPDYRDLLAAAGRRHVRQNFRWSSSIDNLESAYAAATSAVGRIIPV